MSLPPATAERILRARLGAPINPVPHGGRAGQDNDKLTGFALPDGRVLALNRKIGAETHVWFEPPAPPELDGVRLRETPTINSNLSGRLAVLNQRHGLQVEVDTEAALQRFLDWYVGGTASAIYEAGLGPANFRDGFARFRALITAKSGHPFTTFQAGLADVWEGYKPRLREHGFGLLASDTWAEKEIGSGAILQRAINAIEIQDSRVNLTNNLVFWQNRFGHANRDHRVFLEAASNPKLRREIENLLFGLYRGGADEGATFDRLSDLTGGKYPLLAYLFFLKDMDRFMPIQPTGFDRAFRSLGIDFTTLRQCNWANYATYNATLEGLRPLIADASSIKAVRLVDAHSFCWIFSSLLKQEAEGTLAKAVGRKDDGRTLGAREKSIITMRMSVENTVKNANGQLVQRTIKNKELRMTPLQLEKVIASLLDVQENRCAMTGIPFQFHGSDADKPLLPSLDRIDSNGHYEEGNLQVVCQFVNFWKCDGDNEEFKRLLMLVRDVEASE